LRLASMAAELATGLAKGCACPVCGSTSHPAPASDADRVTVEQIKAAELAWQPLDARSRDLDRLLAAAREVVATRGADLAGEPRSLVELTDAVAESTERCAAVERAAHQLGELRSQLTLLHSAEAEQTQRHEQLSLHLAQLAGRIEFADREQTDERTALAQASTRHTQVCPCAQGPWHAGSADRHSQARSAAQGAARAAEALREAHERESAQRQTTEQVCRAEGFAGPVDAAAAMMAPAELESLRETLASAQRRLEVARSTLAEPAMAEALAAAELDLPTLSRTAAEARTARSAAERAHAVAEVVARDTLAAAASVTHAVTEATAAAQRANQTGALADVVTGTGADNTLRMRLSSFVLAGRLERVVELANERLCQLGDGRFRLSHSDQLAAAGRRSGLGLVVADQWTGQTRDTATLSGGESFMAALALALGLADAVREESGGFDLQTLFIDEGFGTLDGESLEEVLGVLDQLRDGGRAVGVISHVEDLRVRIPAQVHVRKTPAGSTVSQTLGVA
ncbi:MAG: SbcC/MukB-like Walker B domain-containing protein, partial [Candidatus Phosphoribacter sp.]